MTSDECGRRKEIKKATPKKRGSEMQYNDLQLLLGEK
jgi:hypothetical protein